MDILSTKSCSATSEIHTLWGSSPSITTGFAQFKKVLMCHSFSHAVGAFCDEHRVFIWWLCHDLVKRSKLMLLLQHSKSRRFSTHVRKRKTTEKRFEKQV
jgi:hypothetical protein